VNWDQDLPIFNLDTNDGGDDISLKYRSSISTELGEFTQSIPVSERSTALDDDTDVSLLSLEEYKCGLKRATSNTYVPKSDVKLKDEIEEKVRKTIKKTVRTKHLPCLYDCGKFYSSEKSLRNHIRLKHTKRNWTSLGNQTDNWGRTGNGKLLSQQSMYELPVQQMNSIGNNSSNITPNSNFTRQFSINDVSLLISHLASSLQNEGIASGLYDTPRAPTPLFNYNMPSAPNMLFAPRTLSPEMAMLEYMMENKRVMRQD